MKEGNNIRGVKSMLGKQGTHGRKEEENLRQGWPLHGEQWILLAPVPHPHSPVPPPAVGPLQVAEHPSDTRWGGCRPRAWDGGRGSAHIRPTGPASRALEVDREQRGEAPSSLPSATGSRAWSVCSDPWPSHLRFLPTSPTSPGRDLWPQSPPQDTPASDSTANQARWG